MCFLALFQKSEMAGGVGRERSELYFGIQICTVIFFEIYTFECKKKNHEDL